MTKLSIVLVFFLGLSVIQALPAAKSKPAITGLIPKTNEKKSLITEEEKLQDEPAKPRMTIENAEELKQGDRAKKSAATTFCVEIRPGTQEQPNKVCDPPSPPPEPPQPEPEYHDCHEYSPYGPISHVDVEVPVNVIPSAPPSTPFIEYYHPVYPPSVYYQQPSVQKFEPEPQPDPQPPQAPLQIYVQPQQPYYPPPSPPIYHLDVVNPCPPPPCSSLVPHLHHLVAVHGKNGMPDAPIEMMRNNDLDDQTQSASYPMMHPQPMDAADMESPNSPNTRNYAVPSPYSRGFSSPIQTYVPQQQQILTSGCASGFAASGRRDSTEGAFNMQVQPQMPIGDQRTFSSGHYQMHATRPTQGYYPMMPMHPGGFNPHRRYPQIRYQRQQNEQKAKDAEIEEKSNDQGNSMTPSKMLNQMRGQESAQKSAPTMQTFPREHDDKDNEKPQIKIHIPSHGEPIVIGSSENVKTSESTKNEGPVVEKKD